jgi:hypothetical protein
MTRVKCPGIPRSQHLVAAAAALAAVLAGGSGRAQDSAAEAAGGARYEVELIVFRHLDPRAATPEAATAAGPAATGGVAWPELAPADLRLAGAAARMRRGPYEVLWHGGWVQPVEGQARAPAAALPPAAAQAGVGGAVTLYRERFLHALIDLAFAAGDGGATLRQGRRLRNAGAHYFDGPVLGVILQARPVPAPAGTAATAPPG